MCVYSMVVDNQYDSWKKRFPIPYLPINPPVTTPAITPQEIADFRKLLERAKEYDKKNNQPDCDLEEKREKLRKLAKELGINIDFV